MADYWKSQPRKFCQYCKCWIADNRPSIDFHERGKNHKENVAAKLSEIKKKSVEKAKQDKKMCKQFAKMEEAANKAYEEDLKRMEREAQGLSPREETPDEPQPEVTPKSKKQKAKTKGKGQAVSAPQVWVEGRSDEGLAYYYNTKTGESQWEKPQKLTSAQQEHTPSSSGGPWVEAVSPEGYTFYYNTESGESNWEKPSGSNTETKGKRTREVALPPPPGVEEVAATFQQGHTAPQQANEQITFRKRKAEAESGDHQEGGEKESKKEEEPTLQMTTDEPRKMKIQLKRRAVNPYGAWERIREEKDPYAKVDLQLPAVEGSSSSARNNTAAPADLPPEPKHKFVERVITSLGGQGGATSFRKTKNHNGKSRSLRQRDADD